MQNNTNEVQHAWRLAADDLGILVVSPFMLSNTQGDVQHYVAWIPHFGSLQGAVCSLIGASDEAQSVAKQYGYYHAYLNTGVYQFYNRRAFIDLLNDWGWHGDQTQTPEWYKGEPWS